MKRALKRPLLFSTSYLIFLIQFWASPALSAVVLGRKVNTTIYGNHEGVLIKAILGRALESAQLAVIGRGGEGGSRGCGGSACLPLLAVNHLQSRA